jgi:MFS superfamily sulfate permease-like transporter
VVVFAGVEQAIVVAIVLSLISHTRRGYSPHNTVEAPTPQGFWRSLPVTGGVQAAPGLVMYRFTHDLYYANAQKLLDESLALTRPGAGPVPVRWLCLDGAAIDDVDFTGGVTLAQVAGTLRQRGVRLVFANVSDHVRAELDRSGVTALVGAGAYHIDLEQVWQEYRNDAARDGPAREGAAGGSGDRG